CGEGNITEQPSAGSPRAILSFMRLGFMVQWASLRSALPRRTPGPAALTNWRGHARQQGACMGAPPSTAHSAPSRSTAGDAHVARHGGAPGAAVDDEVVALWLARDGLVDGLHQERIVGARAQRRAQVGGIVLAEAHVERARAGEAHPVAALAEIVRQRRDEAEPAAGLLHVHVA